MNKNVWIVGTSVSIEDGGYVTHLQRRLPEGTSLNNLSVGDQTSVMGLMRVLDQGRRIRAGDSVVWEYSLLDDLLTEEIFSAADVNTARRLAWTHLLGKNVSIVVLLTPARKHLPAMSACERLIVDDAKRLGLTVIDLRVLFDTLGTAQPQEHYRDDRHPKTDSPVVAATSDAVMQAIASPTFDSTAWPTWRHQQSLVRWKWLTAKALSKRNRIPLGTFQNSLVTVDAAMLSGPGAISLSEKCVRVVGIGCVSTHRTGALWCGHTQCPVTSAKLPQLLPYTFLLRTTGLACRQKPTAIRSAPPSAFDAGVWHDYGQEDCYEPADVAVFGALLEMESTFVSRLVTRWRAFQASLSRPAQ